MLSIKLLLLSLALVATVAADDAETSTYLPPCAPCNRPRRDIDSESVDDNDTGSWGRPRIPGVNININRPSGDGVAREQPETSENPEDSSWSRPRIPGVDVTINRPSRQLPNADGEVDAEDVNLQPPRVDGDVDVDVERPREVERPRGPRRPSGGINIDVSGNLPRVPRIPRPSGGVNVDFNGNGNGERGGSNGFRIPGVDIGVSVDGSVPRIPRPSGDINIDTSRIPRIPRGRGDGSGIRIPGINVDFNVDGSSRVPKQPSGSSGWNINLPNIGLGNLGIPSISDVTGAVSDAAGSARKGLLDAGKAIGHFFKGVREMSNDINERMHRNNYTDGQIREIFANFGAELRRMAKQDGMTGEQIVARINDFAAENDLLDIQKKYIRLIRDRARNAAGNLGLGDFESNVEGFINSTGGFGPAVGKVETAWNENGGVEGIVDRVVNIVRERGPEGLDYQIRLILSQWGLADFMERISGAMKGVIRLYLNANPMIGMAMNIANSINGLQLPSLNFPGFNIVGNLIDTANSITRQTPQLPSTTIRLPRIPRVPANFGVGGQIGNRGLGISFGTDGVQVTRNANPLLGGSLDQTPGMMGNILGTGVEDAFIRTPLRVADSVLRPFRMLPGIDMTRNAIAAAGQFAG